LFELIVFFHLRLVLWFIVCSLNKGLKLLFAAVMWFLAVKFLAVVIESIYFAALALFYVDTISMRIFAPILFIALFKDETNTGFYVFHTLLFFFFNLRLLIGYPFWRILPLLRSLNI